MVKAAAKAAAESVASGSTATSSTSSSSAVKEESLVGKAQKASAKAKGKSRHVQRRDTEEQAERAVAHHFPDWPKEQTHLYQVAGTSLIQQVVKDKRIASKKRQKLGPKYWSGLRDKYTFEGTGKLKPDKAHESMTVNADLVSALQLARTGNTNERTHRPLINWLDGCEALSPREMVGIANHCLELRPSVNQQSRSVVLSVMKLFARHHVQTHHPGIVSRVRKVFDEALTDAYGELKKNRVQLEDWWPIYKDMSGLVLDLSFGERVMQAKGSWTSVEKELAHLTACSTLGHALFHEFHENVVSEKIQIALRKAVAKLHQESKLTKQVITKCTEEFEMQARESDARKILLKRRTVEVSYRGMPIKLEVSSIDEELNLAKAAWLKSHSVPALLPELAFEAGVIESNVTGQQKEVADELLSEFQSARSAAKAMLESVDGGAAMASLLSSKQGLLTSIDGTFVIEIAVCQAIAGEAGVEMMKQKIISLLPTSEAPVTLDQALLQCARLQKGPLFAMASADGRGMCDAVMAMLQKMATGVGPSKSLLANSDFLMQVTGCDWSSGVFASCT